MHVDLNIEFIFPYIYMDYESTSVNRILWIEFYAYHIVYGGIQ